MAAASSAAAAASAAPRKSVASPGAVAGMVAAASFLNLKKLKRGYLDKLPTSSVGSSFGHEDYFRLRYFVLTDTCMYYFEDEDTATIGIFPKGKFELTGSTLQRENAFEFVLQNGKKRLFCRASSEEAANEWFTAISSLMVKVRSSSSST